jgi:hypothetical protein
LQKANNAKQIPGLPVNFLSDLGTSILSGVASRGLEAVISAHNETHFFASFFLPYADFGDIIFRVSTIFIAPITLRWYAIEKSLESLYFFAATLISLCAEEMDLMCENREKSVDAIKEAGFMFVLAYASPIFNLIDCIGAGVKTLADGFREGTATEAFLASL